MVPGIESSGSSQSFNSDMSVIVGKLHHAFVDLAYYHPLENPEIEREEQGLPSEADVAKFHAKVVKEIEVLWLWLQKEHAQTQ
jgi:hypothetical protein